MQPYPLVSASQGCSWQQGYPGQGSYSVIVLRLLSLKYCICSSVPPHNWSLSANVPAINGPAALRGMYYHLDTRLNSTSLSKRDAAHKMDQCVGADMRGKVFVFSRCRPAVSLQAAAVTCRSVQRPKEEIVSTQRCAADEICIETGIGDQLYSAYCVHTKHFAPFSSVDTGRYWNLDVGAHMTVHAHDYTANVLTADESGFRRLQVDKLDAVAWVSLIGHGPKSRDQMLKIARCQRCSRLIMQPIPLAANLLTVTASKRSPDSVSGYLYLVTII